MTMMDEAPAAAGSTDLAGLPIATVATPSGGIRPPLRLSSSILDRYLRERHRHPAPAVEAVAEPGVEADPADHPHFDWFAPVLRLATDDVR